MVDKSALRRAALVLIAARKQLDLGHDRCEHCGMNKYTNKYEWRSAQVLEAMIRKLENMANNTLDKEDT